jgi:hypothetical protein
MDNVEPIGISDLETMSTPFDLRRDLHAFVQYVREYEVKRLVRDNALSVVDYRRLAKRLSDPHAKTEIESDSRSSWIDYVDQIALKLGFVDYDTEGVYRSPSSRSRAYPDNYVVFNERVYRAFLDASLMEQERQLRAIFVDETDGCESEFFSRGYFGRLSVFASWGCQTQVVPHLDFPAVRRFLLDRLSQCEVGEWLSVASLIGYLREHDPYFLIPEEPPAYRLGWNETSRSRYANFLERENQYGRGDPIPDDAPDGFERVEGRYVERFLESAPLTLGYLDVAYGEEPEGEIYPSRGYLQAFRVDRRLVLAQQNEIPEPKVTVQPNFEIYVESAFYPASILDALMPLTEVRSEDVLTVLKLDRDKVMDVLAQEETDVVALLQELSDRPLPNNLVRELKEWNARADKFTLYRGFALLEGEEEILASDPVIVKATAKRISPGVRLLHSADGVFDHLEAEEWAPLWIDHAPSELTPLPEGSHTRLPKVLAEEEREPETNPSVSLTRSTSIMFHSADERFLQAFQEALLNAKCPVRIDGSGEMLVVPGRYRERVDTALDALRNAYDIHIQEEDGG